MAQKTYYAGRDISIQSHKLKTGDVVGTGEIDLDKGTGSFTAAKGLEKVVELGHVIPRLLDGRIVDVKPSPEPSKTPTK